MRLRGSVLLSKPTKQGRAGAAFIIIFAAGSCHSIKAFLTPQSREKTTVKVTFPNERHKSHSSSMSDGWCVTVEKPKGRHRAFSSQTVDELF